MLCFTTGKVKEFQYCAVGVRAMSRGRERASEGGQGRGGEWLERVG